MHLFQNTNTLRKHLVSLTTDLVHFPSHWHKKEEMLELVNYIQDYFEGEPTVIRPFIFESLPSLFITFEETKHPQILLSGHLDVVENSVRYEAEEKEGRLYGSGALDMKGGVACMMAVMKHFCRLKNKPSLGLMLTCDEETGSENGTPVLLNDEGIKADFAIVNEGRWKYDIVTKEKGVMMLKVFYESRGAHSAYPWKAKNPISMVAGTLLEMKKLFPEPSSKWAPTFAVTSFHGGKEFNTIPSYAQAMVNIRFTGGEHWSKQALIKKLKQVVLKGVKVKPLVWGDVFYQEKKNPYVQLLKNVATNIKKKTIHFGENHGASDARFFHEHGIPSVSLGPVGNYHHTNNEYVDIESLVDHAKVLKEFMERVMGKK